MTVATSSGADVGASFSDTAHPSEPAPPSWRRLVLGQRLLPLAERYGLLALFLVVIAVFSLSPESGDVFWTPNNFRNIAGNESVRAILALAAIIPLIAGQFDFSVGLNMELSAIATAAALTRFDEPLAVAVLVGVAIGTAVGAVNGFLVARVGVNPFITTLGMATVITGAIQWYTEGQSILITNEALTDQGSEQLFGIPRPFYILLGVAVIVWYLLGHTPVGRYLQSVGSNSQSARLVGLNVPRLVGLSFVLSGFLSGVAGVLLVARQGGGNPGLGQTFVLPAFAAAFLGATAFKPGRFNVWGTVLAVFFVAFSTTGLVLSKVGTWVEPVFQGGALIIAVAIATVIARRRAGT
jgi:ribose transport system permease protein